MLKAIFYTEWSEQYGTEKYSYVDKKGQKNKTTRFYASHARNTHHRLFFKH